MTRLRPQIHNGLHWVRGELDQSLNRTRTLIESHLDGTKPQRDVVSLQQAAQELHQVRGTASMIQCYGVAAAADEMKLTLQALIQGKLKEPELVYATLLGAVVQLSDYIEALDGGLDDCALILQPMLNELRLVRSQGVLTESDIFVAQLQALNLALPAPDAETRVPGAARGQAQKFLPLFQHSLAHWVRGANDARASLAKMGKIGEQISMHTRSAPLFLLWRSFAACAEAVLLKQMDDSLELKRLVGLAGRQIKLLADQDEEAAVAQLAGLPYQLLFQVGRSSGTGARVSGLRKVFSLATYLPDEPQLDVLRRKIKGPNVTLLTKVAEEIRVDLGQVKDGIDLTVRGVAGAVSLADTRKRLKRIVDTLVVLGLPVLQNVIAEQHRRLEAIPDGQAVTTDMWMDVATAILRVESSLEGALFRTLVSRRTDQPKELEESTPALRDVREGRLALLRESLVNLSRFKASVDALVRKGDSSGLAEAAQMLSEVVASLGILDSAVAMTLVQRLERYVRRPDFAALNANKAAADRTADAVACVEYYLEALRDELPDSSRILEGLAEFVDALDGGEQPAVLAAAPKTAADSVEFVVESAAEIALVTPAETLVAEVAEPSLTPVAAIEPAPAPAADEVDPEIREIFVEEAGDVLSQLQKTTPRWVRDAGNKDLLTELRRSFHTIKGSGRMVGAADLGEFGWSLESMLNRCLDGTITATPALIETVQMGVVLLPDLISGFRDRQPVDARLQPLIERARAIASGATFTAADPEMVAVFREDSAERLQAIKDWLTGLDRSQSAWAVDADVLRAFHTLRGAAALVKNAALQDLSAHAEAWLETARHAEQQLDATGVALIADLHQTVEAWVASVGDLGAPAPDAKPWLERIDALQAALPQQSQDVAEDQQLHEIFAGEAFDLVQSLENQAAAWASAPALQQPANEMKMAAHTLRGAAAMSACQPLAVAAQALHDRIDEALLQNVAPDAAFFSNLARVFESMYQVLDAYRDHTLARDNVEIVELIAALQFVGGSMPPPLVPAAPPAPEPVPELEHAPVAVPVEAPMVMAPAPVEEPEAELDPELLEIFLAEAQELLEEFDRYTAAWEEHPEAEEPPAGLKRVLHTLKGGARMSGLKDLGHLAHRLESNIEDITRSGQLPPAAFHGRMHHIADGLHHALDDLGRGGRPDLSPLLAELEAPLPLAAQAAVTPDLIPAEPAFEFSTEPVTEAAPEPVFELPLEPAPELIVEAAAEVMFEPPVELPIEPAAAALTEPPVDLSSAPIEIEAVTEPVIELSAEPVATPADEPHMIEMLEVPAEFSAPSVEPAPEFLTTATTEVMPAVAADEPVGLVLETLPDEPAPVLEQPIELTLEAPIEFVTEPAAPVVAVMAPVEITAPEVTFEFSSVAESVQLDAPVEPVQDLTVPPADDVLAVDLPLDGLPPLPTEAPVEVPDIAASTLSFEVVAEEPPVAAEFVAESSAAPASAAVAGDLDAELVDTFRAEASELMEALSHALDAWQSNPHNEAPLNDIKRILHTLKGGARMAGLMAMGSASHDMEARIEGLEAHHVLADGDIFARLRVDYDQLQFMQDLLQRGDAAALAAENYRAPVVSVDVEESAALAPVSVAVEAAPAAMSMPPAVVEKQQTPAAVVPAPSAAAPAKKRERGPWHPDLLWQPEQVSASAMAMRRETARVPVEQLDHLLNAAGEISIYRARMEEHNTALAVQLDELTAAIGRVREQLRLMDRETDAQIEARGLGLNEAAEHRYAAEFDPLEMDRYSRMQELSRTLAESIGDIANLRLVMDELASENETLLLQQGRINTEVQQGLMSTLMVPFSRQAARLQRVVKQTAQEEGKLAEIVFEGIESEMDRNVLERMTAPLEHLLRNSVVHGIETPARRKAAGKPEGGTVTLSLRREGTQLAIELRDDGRGLDLAAIREQAVKRGLLPPDATVADDALAQFIFEPGFSTAKTLTQLAGRGVGMDVVASEVKQLGGTLELGSQAGKGARFLIRLPLNLAMSQVVQVGVGEEVYAVPLSSIEGIARIPKSQLPNYYAEGGPLFKYGGNEYRVRHLGDFISVGRDTLTEQRSVNAILVRAAEGLGTHERRIAVVVDALLGNREIVTKSVGAQVSTIPGVSGASIQADGRVVLILDLQALTLDRSRHLISVKADAEEVSLKTAQPVTPAAPAAVEDSSKLIMVVDDSITIRRVTERLLLKNNYRVVTAKDGLDAMGQLQTEQPAVVLLDIEMPRADGFEVATFIRNTERVARTPIIMITSRSGEKHRERARGIGVNRYMIKPFQEDQLLSEIRGVLESPLKVMV